MSTSSSSGGTTTPPTVDSTKAKIIRKITIFLGIVLALVVLVKGCRSTVAEKQASTPEKQALPPLDQQKWEWTISESDGSIKRGPARIARFDGRQMIVYVQFRDQTHRIRTASMFIDPHTSLNGVAGDGHWQSPSPFYKGALTGQLSGWKLKMRDPKGLRMFQGFIDGSSMDLVRVDN